MVRSMLWAMPRTAKMHSSGPAGAHFCPSSSTTKSCPTTARVAKAIAEKKLNVDSAVSQVRFSPAMSDLSLLRVEAAMLCAGSARMPSAFE